MNALKRRLPVVINHEFDNYKGTILGINSDNTEARSLDGVMVQADREHLVMAPDVVKLNYLNDVIRPSVRD